jgi:hypothetical protein
MPREAGSQNVRKDVLGAEGGRKPEGQGWPEPIPAASTNNKPQPERVGVFYWPKYFFDSWQTINECIGKDLEVGSTRTPPRKFSLEKLLPKTPFTEGVASGD